MEMSGKVLAQPVLANIQRRAKKLTRHGVIPELAIITVGGEGAWEAYVGQKIKTAERLGIKTRAIHLSENDEKKLGSVLKKLNRDTKVHGIIVQRPLPKHFNREKIVESINIEKDVDGFSVASPYMVPTVLAAQHFIRHAYGVIAASGMKKVLKNQSFLIVGKGETAGQPAIDWLRSQKAAVNIIDSKTSNPCQEIKKADVIITCVGKSNIIKAECLKKGAVLIGTGIHKENGKLIGDYDVEKIKGIAKAWTPTPGGVGPLNLAYLFKNLITAAEKQSKS